MDEKEKTARANNPIGDVKWIPVDDVVPNRYNPNFVAKQEMELLYTSIREDGYTQPCVVSFDENQGKYVIVDGFHRYYILKNCKDIFERCCGLLPCVVLSADMAHRMESTVRHNRARGEHEIGGMGSLIMKLLVSGKTDAEVCHSLGLKPDELNRMKYITGYAKLFKGHKYEKSWKSKNQIKIEEIHKEHPEFSAAEINKVVFSRGV